MAICPFLRGVECSVECPLWFADYSKDKYECAVLSIARSLSKISEVQK